MLWILIVLQKYTKFAKFAGLYLPHFTTASRPNFAILLNFKMLFLAIVMDLVLLA